MQWIFLLLFLAEKVEAIVNYPVPKTVKEVRRFLGIAGWYHRFVPSFAAVAAPLTNLMKKNKQFKWSSGCAEAFAKLKECLISAPVLRCPDFSTPFSIQCDASDFGIAATLSQTHEDGEHVIAFISRSLDKRERNFTVTEKECLAVVFGITKFRPYIEGTRFTVVTDLFNLKWLHNL